MPVGKFCAVDGWRANAVTHNQSHTSRLPFDVSLGMSWGWIGLAALGYWGLCRSLRYRLINTIERRFKGRDPYSLSVEEAQLIIKQLFELDCPYLSRFSTAFALFRTYGILSIAQILIK